MTRAQSPVREFFVSRSRCRISKEDSLTGLEMEVYNGVKGKLPARSW